MRTIVLKPTFPYYHQHHHQHPDLTTLAASAPLLLLLLLLRQPHPRLPLNANVVVTLPLAPLHALVPLQGDP